MLILDRRRFNTIANTIVTYKDSTKQMGEYNSSKVKSRFVLLANKWILKLHISSSNESFFIAGISTGLKISSLEEIL